MERMQLAPHMVVMLRDCAFPMLRSHGVVPMPSHELRLKRGCARVTLDFNVVAQPESVIRSDFVRYMKRRTPLYG